MRLREEPTVTTIRQLIRKSPVRANELVAQLADTSDTAIKTRERLLSELKVEFDLHSQLEEQYLFPVLKKYKKAKGLVAEAMNDNRETRRLLAQIDRTSKRNSGLWRCVMRIHGVSCFRQQPEWPMWNPAMILLMRSKALEL